jgi:sugar phosphate isomerase/epimerase
MKHDRPINRRRFLQTSLLASSAAATASLAPVRRALADSASTTPSDPYHGLKVGVTSYTFNKFSLDQAIAMTKEAGVKYFSIKEVHLPLKSTSEQRHAARKKIEDAGLVIMGAGVIYFKNNPNDIRNVFEYAKDTGVPTIICSPDPDALDTAEKMAKEYDIRIAIHNHGPTDKKYPSPLDVLKLVKDRDQRMGICMDVGHTVRIGEDPVAVMNQCAQRLYDFHMKDVTEATPKGKATEVGKGVIDIPAVLRTLIKLKWPYHVALEYEANSSAPMPGVLESFAYIRKVLAEIG